MMSDRKLSEINEALDQRYYHKPTLVVGVATWMISGEIESWTQAAEDLNLEYEDFDKLVQEKTPANKEEAICLANRYRIIPSTILKICNLPF